MSILFTIGLFIVILSFLVFVHEFGHFIAAKLSGVLVREFSIGFPPHIFKKKYGETTYKIGVIPMGGYVNLYGENGDQDFDPNVPKERAFNSQANWKKLMILSGGVIMNILTAVVLIGLVIGVAGKQRIISAVKITEVFSESPAVEAGIEADDYILAYGLNAESMNSVTTGDSFISFIKSNADTEVVLEISDTFPAENTEAVLITPIDFYNEGTGSLGVRIEAISEYEYTNVPWYQVPIVAVGETIYLFDLMIESLSVLVQNLFSGVVPEDVAGPVGIAVVSADVARQGIIPLIQFVALISLNLALVNILPFPALDGGRIAFVLLEMMLRRPLDAKVQGWIHIGGFVVLSGLFVAITVYDVIRFF